MNVRLTVCVCCMVVGPQNVAPLSDVGSVAFVLSSQLQESATLLQTPFASSCEPNVRHETAGLNATHSPTVLFNRRSLQ
jgi:hypothetical protein